MSNGTCIIVAAGSVDPADFPPVISGDDLLIAADAGCKILIESGIKPHLVIGDFDSSNEPTGDFEVIKLPVEKDDTDTVFSVREGFRRGYRNFIIYGALGGSRISHSIANIQLLTMLKEMGCRGKLIFGSTSLFVLGSGDKEVVKGRAGDHVSLFSLSETATVSTVGLYYPLSGGLLKRNFPLGVSNSLTGEEASILVHEGELLVVIERLSFVTT